MKITGQRCDSCPQWDGFVVSSHCEEQCTIENSQDAYFCNVPVNKRLSEIIEMIEYNNCQRWQYMRTHDLWCCQPVWMPLRVLMFHFCFVFLLMRLEKPRNICWLPMWDTGFLTPGFGLAQPQVLQPFKEWTSVLKISLLVSAPFCVTLPLT